MRPGIGRSDPRPSCRLATAIRYDMRKVRPEIIAVVIAVLTVGTSATAEEKPATAPAAASALDVNQLFATTCGWCHSDGGRSPGKGPKLMDTKRSDEYI